jgi:modulator of FtsH protease
MPSHNNYDFTQLGQVSENQQLIVLRKAYALLGLSFLPCAAGAYAGASINFYSLFSNSWLSVLAFLIFAYGLTFAIEKNRYNNVGIALLMVLTFGIGFFISPLLQLALASPIGSQVVGMAAMMTAGVFLIMATIAHHSKSNMNGIGQFLLVGAVVLIIGMILNMILQLPILSLTIAGGFVVFSSLMIMWQIRTVIAGGEDSATSAALTLFISLYNIFTSLVHILLAIMDDR